ncbi:hypothetical protein D9M73_252660 [compost metagenome]
MRQDFGGFALAVIVDAHRIAAFGGEQRGGGTDAPAGAGDQHDFHEGIPPRRTAVLKSVS